MSEIIEQTSGALALSGDLAAELMAAAKNAAAQERPKVAKISTKSGILATKMGPVAGNAMEVVIIGAAHRSTLYMKPYNSDVMEAPSCFAASADGVNLTPHESVQPPMSPSCKSCKYYQFESIRLINPDSTRKSKACKETRRLVVLPANQLTGAQDVLSAELAVLDVPVTSIPNYAKLVNVISTTLGRPAWAVVTRVAVQPHLKNQLEITFTPVRHAGGDEIIRALQARHEEAMNIALAPYDLSVEQPAEAAPTVEEKPKKPAKF